MERYFVSVSWQTGERLSLYRFVVDMDPIIFAEERWADGEWVETDRIMKYLHFGEGDFEEISLDDAKAFIAANAATTNA